MIARVRDLTIQYGSRVAVDGLDLELHAGERLERLLKNAKATIVEKREVDGREAWDVEGLTQAGLKRTVFYFRAGTLCEVELQYQRENWDQPKYDEYMGQIRRSIEKRFGPGQLIARKTEPEGDVVQTVVGYKWNKNLSLQADFI